MTPGRGKFQLPDIYWTVLIFPLAIAAILFLCDISLPWIMTLVNWFKN